MGSIVVNNHTVKPLDEQTLARVAKICGCVVTVEEHQIQGGLGAAVAEVLARSLPVSIEYVGMPDSFGESGEPEELLEKYGMTACYIMEKAKLVIGRKNHGD
ncbi:MAG: hypothetical protein HYW38_00945 [Candidatus Colwellbacteria bacterium]|nr:hypothetical protein [Candidatus Colwellbacteria bacterium]